MPIHELVHLIFKSGPLASLRLPSLAGSGLPERMRSTAFALLGLTAAAGLALVAIFAQPGFPLLEPVPLPHGPPARQGVAGALALPLGHSRTSLAPAAGGRAAVPRPSADGSRGDRAGGGDEPGGVVPESASAVPVKAPVADAPEGSGGGGHGARGGAAAPAPSATPEPASTTASAPASTPKPIRQAPEAITSSANPEPAQAPGNSSSAAAAEHASERGVEASSKGPPTAPEASAQAAASTPGPASGPVASGHGNAYAKGQSK